MIDDSSRATLWIGWTTAAGVQVFRHSRRGDVSPLASGRDLALAILADHFQDDDKAEQLRHEFAERVIERLDLAETWTVTADTITEWMYSRAKQVAGNA